MNTLSTLVSDFIRSFFRERFPAAAEDPATTALVMGFIVGSLVTWLIYRLVHKARINGLQATNGILEARLKQRDEEIDKLKCVSTGLIKIDESKQDDIDLEFKPFF